MRNSSVALYIGCTLLSLGGLGWAARTVTDPGQPAIAGDQQVDVAEPLYLATVTMPAAIQAWPAQGTGVAFHAEMVELLTPKAAIVAREEEAEPQAKPRRADVQEVTRKKRQKKASRRDQRKGRDASRYSRGGDVEVVVRDRFGNPVRTMRVPREGDRRGSTWAQERREPPGRDVAPPWFRPFSQW